MSEPRGTTVTLLFVDIVGSTRLLADLGDDYAGLLGDYRRLMTEAAGAERGTVIDSAGDGLFLSFPTARGALMAALAAQRAFRDHQWPRGAQVEARMGIHTGEPVTSDSTLVGIDVHRAARICAAGHGGQILVSVTTHELLGGDAPADTVLRDLGEHRLKDLPRPEHVFQVSAADLPAEFPPLLSLDNWPNNLPRHLSSFVGRAESLEAVTERLGTTPLLTLVGPGGVGKTRLALEAAARAMDVFPDGAWVVQLGGLGDETLVPERVASTLRIKEQPGVLIMATLADHLAGRHMLLIFDDCEQVLEAAGDVVAELLRSSHGLRVLATSREALGIAGESLYPVPSLDLPQDSATLSVEQLAETEAVRLFTERARAVQPAFVLNERNAAAVAQICRRLDGIPLAIELAAARVKALPPDQIASRLDDRFRLLTGGSRMALPRHRTLKAAMDWSYDLLTNAERAVFTRLSVFAGGFGLGAIEYVCADDDVLAVEALDLLSRLIDRSLVMLEATSTEARYRLLDTVQQYAQERLVELDPGGTARNRHRTYMVSLVDRLTASLFAGPHGSDAFEQLAAEHDNLRAALQWSDDDPAGGADELRLASGLWRYWEVGGHLVEGRGWLTRAVARTHGEISELRANALVGLGSLSAQQGDLAAADAAHEAALETHRQLGEPRGIAYTASNVANIAVERGDFARARALQEDSIAIVRAAGDNRALAIGMMNLADIVARQGDVEEARRLYGDAVAIFRGEGDLIGLALALGQEATFHLQQGATQVARARHEEALEIFRQFGDGRGVARTEMFLGDIAAVDGDIAAADQLYRSSIAQRQQLGDRGGLATACDRLARIELITEPERAARLIGFADAQREAIGASLPPADASERDQVTIALAERLGDALPGLRAEGRRNTLGALLARATDQARS